MKSRIALPLACVLLGALALAAGPVEMSVFQNSGVTLAVPAVDAFTPELAMTWLGPA